MKPTPQKPRIIIAHVEGSGTAATSEPDIGGMETRGRSQDGQAAGSFSEAGRSAKGEAAMTETEYANDQLDDHEGLVAQWFMLNPH
jgi:hypothetical protein